MIRPSHLSVATLADSHTGRSTPTVPQQEGSEIGWEV